MSSLRQLLLNSLTNLAAEPEAQIEYLRSIGAVSGAVDELVLEFADAAAPIDEMIRLGELKGHEAKHVRAVLADIHRDLSSRDEELWIVDALSTSPQWARARCSAERCLSSLSRPQA